jgi:hypothetical protein
MMNRVTSAPVNGTTLGGRLPRIWSSGGGTTECVRGGGVEIRLGSTESLGDGK